MNNITKDSKINTKSVFKIQSLGCKIFNLKPKSRSIFESVLIRPFEGNISIS